MVALLAIIIDQPDFISVHSSALFAGVLPPSNIQGHIRTGTMFSTVNPHGHIQVLHHDPISHAVAVS